MYTGKAKNAVEMILIKGNKISEEMYRRGMKRGTLGRCFYEVKVVGFAEFENQIPSHLNLLLDSQFQQ